MSGELTQMERFIRMAHRCPYCIIQILGYYGKSHKFWYVKDLVSGYEPVCLAWKLCSEVYPSGNRTFMTSYYALVTSQPRENTRDATHILNPLNSRKSSSFFFFNLFI